jgi:hypothetical protein
VKTLGILRHVLAIFVIAGLIAGPLAASAAADTAQVAAMGAISDEMPCCPQKPPPDDCPKCPFMAVCSMPQCLLGLPAGMVMGALTLTAARLPVLLSDLQRDGLGYSPPPRPPRSLILSA